MSLQVTGKNIELGEAFQNYVDDRLNAAIEKYVGRHLSAHIRAEKERGRFLTSCTVTLHTGLVLEASGEGADAYASAENAFERLEKRLRRYKRRLTSQHHNGMASGRREVPETLVNDYVVRVAEEDGVDHAETGEATGVS
ncbi:MAG: ribosome-associated translation inhibitor RaiA, partial [Hyphomicrobiaceae bacterium]